MITVKFTGSQMGFLGDRWFVVPILTTEEQEQTIMDYQKNTITATVEFWPVLVKELETDVCFDMLEYADSEVYKDRARIKRIVARIRAAME